MEIWKWVPGFEGEYEVSNQGGIRSYVQSALPRPIKTFRRATGYRAVSLGAGYIELVHRIVAIAFIPNPLDLPYVNHKNAIKTNNRVENLEWVTQQENVQHAIRMGLRRPNPARGETANQSNLNDGDVLTIRKLYSKSGLSQRAIAKQYGISKHSVYSIVNRLSWTHI